MGGVYECVQWGEAEEGEIDSLRIFDLFPCVSDSVLNALGPCLL